MSDSGDSQSTAPPPRLDDIERALVLAREVASATKNGGAANLRTDHLRALFANGNGAPGPERMQAALEAAGVEVDPPLRERPDNVSLRVNRARATLGNAAPPAPEPAPAPAAAEPPRRLSGMAAYEALGGGRRKSAASAPEPAAAAEPGDPPQPATPATAAGGITLDDAQRLIAAQQADQRIPQSIAALMPALIAPVLAASFLGPLFGILFAGLALLTSLTLSRPGALADGKLGPIRMPASLARSFLLFSSGVAVGALVASLVLVAAGGGGSDKSDPNAPLREPAPARPEAKPQTTTPPAPPANDAAQQRRAAAVRRARAERRRERRERAREKARERESQPPSGGGSDATDSP